ncbi:MAG: Tn3 family transposase, partial [Pseudomonadota bacterium]
IVNSIKSGALNLLHSYRYRALGDYLINLEEWRKNRTAILQTTGLDQFQDGQLALDNLKSTLDPLFHTVNKRYLHGDNSWIGPTYDNRHTVRTPKTDFDDTSSIAATLDAEGYIPVYQVLTEVNRITQFTKHFRHFSTKNVKMSPSSVGVLAGIIAKGCNISLSKLPYISNGLSEHRLRNAIRWRFDLENIRGANRRIVDAISSLSLAENYVAKAKFAHTSSDGHKINVAVDCLHANHSYKYFGKDKGVTHYTFIDEKQSLLYSRIFTASDREAPYVIDGLLSNNVSSGQIHSTDTHGYTEQIFGAAYFLNISFAPRLKKISHQRIYSFSTRRSYEKLNYPLLPSRKIDSNIILQQWEEILRFMATIKLQHASAAQLFKRMSSYARDHPLYKALKEFGRIIKSQFILTYYDDVELRQRIQKQLNRVELSNKFSRAVFFDNDQAFQDGDLEEQEIASACKVLIQNAVIFWNYLCLSEKVLMEEKRSNKAKLASKIAAGSVITWRHVNFRGEYDFRRSAGQGHQFNYSKIKTMKFNSLPR